MSSDAVSNQAQPEDDEVLAPEVLDRIKHPPAIDDAMLELDPEELLTNPAVPQTIQESRDLRDDLHRG